MAYVRYKGKQLAIVQGERDAKTGKVEQRVLFTLCSKAEAVEAIGRGSGGEPGALRFQGMLENEYPGFRFNWETIRRNIEEKLSHLPDLYQYRKLRLKGQFRDMLLGFVRQLVLADPQELESSAKVIAEHKYELEFLSELIHWRLKQHSSEKNEWNSDNPFYWRYALRGREVPPETEEMAVGYYEQGEYQKADAVFRMLVEAFDDYAEGHNYLGLIALAQDRYKEAVGHFRRTIDVGRRLFPKCLAKKYYWDQLSTRPYMRGLRNLTLTLIRVEEYIEALEFSAQLERECGDEKTARWNRAMIYLNIGHWQNALESSAGLSCELHPDASFIAGFAAAELGEYERAIGLFLYAALHYPRAARMLAGMPCTSVPTHHHEIDDYNVGVAFKRNLHGFLDRQESAAIDFFQQFIAHPAIASLINEIEVVVGRWNERCGDSTHEEFERIKKMQSISFIHDLVQDFSFHHAEFCEKFTTSFASSA